MSSNLKVNTILPSTGTTIGIGTVGGLINVVGNINVNSTSGISTFNGLEISGIVTAKAGAAVTYYGDGSNLTNLPAQATIANNADNRVITGGSGVNLNGEANLTWDGSTLSATGSDAQIRLYDSTASSENSALRVMAYNGVNHIQSGKAFTSDSKADLIFGSMFGGTEWLRITSDGLVKWDGHTLAERNAATGVAGGLIYNSEGKIFQYYDGSGWITLNTTNQIVATGGNTVYTGTGAAAGYKIHDFSGNGTFEITSGVGEVEVLVVAGGGSEGGGSAGCHAGGGGGGGGVVYKKMNMSAGKYTVTIGAGGLWRNNGENTTFGSGTDHQIIALGGGAGGPTLTGNGNAGGSGGGGSRHTTTNVGGAATQPSSADGGFGNAGGDTGNNTATGGGGGAGGAGQDGDAANAGRGGPGKQFTQFGVSIYFGAGGNAQGSHTSEGQTPINSNGAGNTGAGAGGSAGGGTRYYGGSGRVIVRYPAAS